MSPTVLEIEAAGSPREIGRAVGEAARDLIAKALDFYRAHHHEMGPMDFADAEREAMAYLPAARRWLPTVIEELEGIAEAARVPLSALLVPNLGEELTCNDDPAATVASNGPDQSPRDARRSGGHCTTVAINAAGRHVVAHNEDWFAGDADALVLRLTTADGTRLIAVTSPPMLAPSAISSHGIATGANTVYADDHRVGVPNNLLRRRIIEAKSLDEARDLCLIDARARGSNHLFGDVAGRVLDVETSATAAATIEADDWCAHTNHYVTEAMAPHDRSSSVNSRERLARARELVAAGLAEGDDPAVVAARVLADHANGDDCICGHPDRSVPLGEQEMTVFSMIWDLDASTVDVSFGPPCENERVRYTLD